MLGIWGEFEVVPSEIEEVLDEGPIGDAVAQLALRKARAVAGRVGVGVVLAADTVVVVDGLVLGKPSGPEEAREMLVRLRGRWHEVITGVAVIDAGTGRAASTTAVSRVLMANYSDATVEAYVASGSPFDKAGLCDPGSRRGAGRRRGRLVHQRDRAARGGDAAPAGRLRCRQRAEGLI